MIEFAEFVSHSSFEWTADFAAFINEDLYGVIAPIRMECEEWALIMCPRLHVLLNEFLVVLEILDVVERLPGFLEDTVPIDIPILVGCSRIVDRTEESEALVRWGLRGFLLASPSLLK